IASVFNLDRRQAKARINNYYATYPLFRRASLEAQAIVEKHGKIPFWSGRFRHFDFPASESRKAFNSVIQGGSADIVERVMLAVDKEGFPGTHILLTVHDSVIVEIENEYKKEVVPEIKRIMENVSE